MRLKLGRRTLEIRLQWPRYTNYDAEDYFLSRAWRWPLTWQWWVPAPVSMTEVDISRRLVTGAGSEPEEVQPGCRVSTTGPRSPVIVKDPEEFIRLFGSQDNDFFDRCSRAPTSRPTQLYVVRDPGGRNAEI